MKESNLRNKDKEIEDKDRDYKKIYQQLEETSKMLKEDQLDKKKKNRDRKIS